MGNVSFRQIHLDFHTSEHMPDVGSRFSEENFKKALIDGHVSSITLFSKCHHGWSYHPTSVNAMHPTLNTNLLDRQLRVCEELSVRTQIYISAGYDERKAVLYPQFLSWNKKENNPMLGARFHRLCLNNDEYLEMLILETKEVLKQFGGRFDGLFYDICMPCECVCPTCINSMLKLGLNPESDEDVKQHDKITYNKFTQKIVDAVKAIDPDMPVFFNCGNIPRDDRSIAYANTHHLEIESLPTGGWGYDHFPLSAAYTRVLGRDFVGMTGKFHKSWGEFGGFKHPNALIYETSLSVANGAMCSVGDQLHPLGMFDNATYSLIGKAYERIEKIEKYCEGAKNIADIAIFTTYTDETRYLCADVGANRMLLEGKYLYNIIDKECNFSDYNLIIFPDTVEFDSELAKRTTEFIAAGGKILLSGKSGTKNGEFFENFAEFKGESRFDTSYLVPNYEMPANGISAYFMYQKGYVVENFQNAEIMAYMQDAYFNREYRRFCSHANTPNNPESLGVGAFISGNIGYIAWNIFTEYGKEGAFHHKQIVCDMLDKLLGDKRSITTNLQSNGIITLQAKDNKYLINHLLYPVTKNRGEVEVIEDAIDIINTNVSVKCKKPQKVFDAFTNEEIPFIYENGVLKYTVPRFALHTAIIIEL